MKTVATMDLAEAAWYLKNGLELSGIDIRTSTVEPRKSRVDMLFSGDQAAELSVICITDGPRINAHDLERLSVPLSIGLANAYRGGRP